MRRKSVKLITILVVILPLSLIAARVVTHAVYAKRIFADVPELLAHVPANAPATDSRVAIVFGAGVWRSGQPSPVLFDRIATAADLYKQGRVTKVLMSGDNRFINYNEPIAMREKAVELGITEKDVVLDYAGRRTYDSCYRAREIFGVERAILITQAFHLDRAMYLCSSMGIDSIGVTADRRPYGRENEIRWEMREAVAMAGALLDMNLLHPTPVMGDKIPIDASLAK
ncbi:MAG: SanA/YdcF family protein [Pyrinomonadaceae bacterium]